jgi:hypothetical protein
MGINEASKEIAAWLSDEGAGTDCNIEAEVREILVRHGLNSSRLAEAEGLLREAAEKLNDAGETYNWKTYSLLADKISAFLKGAAK